MNKDSLYDYEVLSKIRKHVDAMTSGLNEHRKDVYSFKEDLKLSIIVLMEDLIASGNTVEDALNTAVYKCKNNEVFQCQINNLMQKNNVSETIYYKTACISLVLFLLLLVTAYIYNLIIINFTPLSKSYPVLSDKLAANVNLYNEAKLGVGDKLINKELKDSVKSYVDSKWFVDAVGLYVSDYSHRGEIGKDFLYTYASNGKNLDSEHFSEKKLNFFFSYYLYHDYAIVPNTNITVDAVYKFKVFGVGFFEIILILLLIYWISFALWARLNIYYAGIGNHWVFIVFLTNIIGYLGFEYYMDKKRGRLPSM